MAPVCAHNQTTLHAYRNEHTDVIFTRKRMRGRCNPYVHKGDTQTHTHTHRRALAAVISVTVLSTLRLLFRGFVGTKESGEMFAQRDGDVEGVQGGYPFLHTSETMLLPLTAATW